MGSGIHVGIDLGTSNSAIALFDGESVSVIANGAGETLTPSVVRIDARGGRTVGRRAHRALDGDPANTRAEWKRLMGTAERLPFVTPGLRLSIDEGARFWGLDETVCELVLAELVADGFLARGRDPRFRQASIQ